MSHNQVEFLSRPLLCKFASIGTDGSPHVTPVWFMYDKGRLVIATPETTVKARNVSRNSRVAILIDDGETYMMIKGRARIARERDPRADLKRLALRYEGPAAARKSVPELLKEIHVSIEVIPDRVISQNI